MIFFQDSDTSEPEIVSVQSQRPPSETCQTGLDNSARWSDTIQLPDIEIPSFRFDNGNVIKTGGTLELRDHSIQVAGAMHSGDFVHVKRIIKNLETDELRFQGHRMRRTKYLGQIFDCKLSFTDFVPTANNIQGKLNELCMVLPITEGENTCPFVAGMEEFAVKDVIGVRECELTNKPYPLKSFRDGDRFAYPAFMSKEEIRLQVFQGGRLCCRVVMILSKQETRTNTKTVQKFRSGIIRQLYASETVTHSTNTPSPPGSLLKAGNSHKYSITVDDDEQDVMVVSHGKRRPRSVSFEILDEAPSKRPLPHPTKRSRYTIGDVFCGAGGASQGAAQAGIYVAWGLDKDKPALEAYLLNHPGASGYLCNAHNFPPCGKSIAELRTDILHLSPPCCFFAPCQFVKPTLLCKLSSTNNIQYY